MDTTACEWWSGGTGLPGRHGRPPACFCCRVASCCLPGRAVAAPTLNSRPQTAARLTDPLCPWAWPCPPSHTHTPPSAHPPTLLSPPPPACRYKWYRGFEAQSFPDPMGLRDLLARYSLGLYPNGEPASAVHLLLMLLRLLRFPDL